MQGRLGCDRAFGGAGMISLKDLLKLQGSQLGAARRGGGGVHGGWLVNIGESLFGSQSDGPDAVHLRRNCSRPGDSGVRTIAKGSPNPCRNKEPSSISLNRRLLQADPLPPGPLLHPPKSVVESSLRTSCAACDAPAGQWMRGGSEGATGSSGINIELCPTKLHVPSPTPDANDLQQQQQVTQTKDIALDTGCTIGHANAWTGHVLGNNHIPMTMVHLLSPFDMVTKPRVAPREVD